MKTTMRTSKRRAEPKRLIRASGAELPMEKNTPNHNFMDYSILVLGEKKIGKTTLFQYEDSLYLEFDPLQEGLSAYQRHVKDWPTLVSYVDKLEDAYSEGKDLPYKSVTVDGIDLGYSECMKYVCNQLGIKHPHLENDFGYSWTEVKKEFTMIIRRLLNLPVGIRFISHSTVKQVPRRNGMGTIEKWVPNLSGQAEEVIVGLTDIQAAYLYDDDQRVLVISGDELTSAGHRLQHNFLTTDGRPVREIPMGESPKEAYENLVAAFKNQQPFASLQEQRDKQRAMRKEKKTVKLPE